MMYFAEKSWSGYTESNRATQLGRLVHYHYAIPAHGRDGLKMGLSQELCKWWRGLDSNQCTQSGQIYSLVDLTTLPPLRRVLHNAI